MTAPIVNIDSVELQPRPAEYQPPPGVAPRIDARIGRLSAALALSHLGCSLVEVPPGRQGWPFHGHRQNDELFFILSGEGTLRHGQTRQPVRAGDLVACPAGGPESAHALINTGTEPLRYLALSSQHDPEICDYPDSGKFGVWGGSGEAAFEFIGRAGQALDYWDGE